MVGRMNYLKDSTMIALPAEPTLAAAECLQKVVQYIRQTVTETQWNDIKEHAMRLYRQLASESKSDPTTICAFLLVAFLAVENLMSGGELAMEPCSCDSCDNVECLLVGSS